MLMSKKRLNKLTRGEWLKYSISVWTDLMPSKDDSSFKTRHPAIFPLELPVRMIRIFTHKYETVLDPFMGTGTTLVACEQLMRNGIGIDISSEFVGIAKERLAHVTSSPSATRQLVYCDDSRNLLKYVNEEESIDFLVTSPPYWKIQKVNKTFLKKEATPYTSLEDDLGNIEDYNEYLQGLIAVFSNAFRALRPGKFAVIDLMDVRIGDKFYALHADLIARMKEIGFDLWDIIVWDRHQEYNALRAMRYPYTFYVNKVHEYLLFFHKPATDVRVHTM